mmetsp:Transcript_13342/g.30426  ORF Transcript_13342/g.30426 Transcript_13342/m.30426 type:complete len:347 (-) Transcript_13342:59-1099(-)
MTVPLGRSLPEDDNEIEPLERQARLAAGTTASVPIARVCCVALVAGFVFGVFAVVGVQWAQAAATSLTAAATVPIAQFAAPGHPTGVCKVVPSILGLGVGHFGSTSLAEYLGANPYLHDGIKKEHQFFCGLAVSQKILKGSLENFSSESWRSYVNEFPVPCRTQRTFDISGAYLRITSQKKDSSTLVCRPEFRGREGIQRIVELFPPDLQVLVIVRDPVDQMRSDHNWTMSEITAHRQGGCWARWIAPWVEILGVDRIKVLDFNEMTDPEKFRQFMEDLYSWLRVPRMPDSFFKRLLKQEPAGRRRQPKPFQMAERRSFHRLPDMRKCKRDLEAMIGHRLDWLGAP